MRELSGQHDGAGTDCGGPNALEVAQPEYHKMTPDVNQLKVKAMLMVPEQQESEQPPVEPG